MVGGGDSEATLFKGTLQLSLDKSSSGHPLSAEEESDLFLENDQLSAETAPRGS